VTERMDHLPVHQCSGWDMKDGRLQERSVETALEEPLAIEINDRRVALLMRLPGMEKELAAGYCVSEGLIASFDQVLTIHHCGGDLPGPVRAGDSRNRVSVRVHPEAIASMPPDQPVRLIRAGCGTTNLDGADLDLPVLPDGFSVDAALLPGLPRRMQEGQRLRRRVGGVHAVGIFDARGTTVTICEDIGRHNAADKAIGYCLLRDIPLTDKIMLCSGRLSYEMVTKAIRAGIPVLTSVSAPTSLALQLAQQFNVSLIGYVRGRRYTVYAHPERLVQP